MRGDIVSSEIVPAFIGRTFDQICFVVQDLEEAMEFWRRTKGVDVWSVAIDLAKDQTDKEYLGEPEDFNFSCAYGFLGETMIELARHESGKSLYKDWLDEGGRGPHHIGFRLADAEELAKAEAAYRSTGVEKAMGGLFQTPTASCRWSYWDTRRAIGCYAELYFLGGDAEERMARMKAGEAVDITE
jgi:catechol 2,3-dioxygenase-like lactoylglutathione lyase family enzyme